MKDRFTTKLSNDSLAPLIKYVGSRRGTVNVIVQKLSERTGKKWRRENVERWLHQDSKKRTQPLFGVGLLLIQIGMELTNNHQPTENV